MHFSAHLKRFVILGLYLVLLTPLVFQHHLMSPLITAKTLFFQIFVALIVSCYAVLAYAEPEYRPRRTAVGLAFVAYIATLFLSSAFGIDFTRSFWSIPERMTGLFFMLHLSAFFVVLSGIIRGPVAWRRYLISSSGISFVVALFPALQLIFPSIFFDPAALRFSGTVGNPIFLAAYLLFHVFIAGHYAIEARMEGRKRLAAFCSVIAIFDLLVILMTQTRGALVGLVAGLAVFSVSYVLRPFALGFISPRRGRQVIFAAWAALILFSTFFFVTRSNPVWQAVPILSRLSTQGLQAAPRLMAWRIGLASFADRPFFGWGSENFYAGFNAHYDPRFLRYGSGEIAFDKPHNIFVQSLAETGIVGFAAYLAFLILLCIRFRRKPWFLALLAGYCAQDFFAFDTVTSFMMLAIVAAYAVSSDSPDPSFSSTHRAPSVPLAVSFGLAFLALSYFVYYPVWRASHAEWTSINEFIQRRVSEGRAAFDEALSVRTPYIDNVRKDLGQLIGQMHHQNLALPDARALIARAADELRTAVRNNLRDYSFPIAFAEFSANTSDVDTSYLSEAEQILVDAEKFAPGRQTTLHTLSKILYLKGDKQGAADAYRRSIALDPEVADPHFYYSMLLLQTGDVSGAAKEVDEAERLGRAPKNAAEAVMFGSYFGDAGDYARSIRYLQQALLFDSRNAESKLKLGLVYYFDRQLDAARNVLREVMKTEDLKRSPQYPLLQPILRELGL